MADPRHRALAETLVGYSCALEAGETVLIEAVGIPHAFTRELVRVAAAAGARPLVWLKEPSVTRELLLAASREQMDLMALGEATTMERVDAYIGIRGGENISELSDVPAEATRLWESTVFQRVHLDERLKKKWVVLRWPSASMAQLAGRSTAAFEDFYFDVCTLDYARMARAMEPLVELMNATDRVRLTAPGTDLSFSIRDIPAVPCDGRRNIPDGEVYTAPVRDSIEGTIRFNTPTVYQGVAHQDVELTFEAGRIVEAGSSKPDHLLSVLDSDEGARFVGEFAIGFHPGITEPMRDILFDEKIAGSIHLTPGNAYQEAWNGNRSQIHWDLVLMMDPAHGGGTIHFDDRLVRRDGRFVLPELEALNPENLLGE
ncbi:MAG: aminopeptidase [Thermoanaerobaculia bacterium]